MSVSRAGCSVVAAASLLALMSGCVSTTSGHRTHHTTSVSAAISAPVHRTDNRICPLTGLPVEASAPVTNFRGYDVGFCREGCVLAWGLLTDSEKVQLVSRVIRIPNRQPKRQQAHGGHRRDRSAGR
jgi:hypothetical protein